jgi:hypothetical protein
MGRLLLAIGGALYVLLGVVHGVLLLRDLRVPRTFTPHNDSVRVAMQNTTVAIHPSANLWRAWMGFNLSHSLGLLLAGIVLLSVVVQDFDMFGGSLLFKTAAIAIATAYVALSKAFWFRDPLIGSSIGLACVIGASIAS